MTFNEFLNEINTAQEDPSNLITTGFIQYIPVKIDEEERKDGDEFEYEMSVDDMLVCVKPNVRINYVTDVYQTYDFVQLDLEFLSNYDSDIIEIYEFLKKYENLVKENYDDFLKCPSCSTLIVPPKKYLEENVHYLELQMPFMIHLTTNKTNQMPNIISMLFPAEKCFIHEHEEDIFDLEEIKKEIVTETAEEQRKLLEEEEQQKKAEYRKAYLDSLQDDLNVMDMNDPIIRIEKKENDEYEDNESN